MSTATKIDRRATEPSEPSARRPLRRLHGAAIARIGFGLVWAIDASFKWLPGFVHGQTLDHDLGGAAKKANAPIIHQWIQLWHAAATAHPAAFAVGTAIAETLIALALILGAFSNLVFIGSAVFSFGIWSAPEGFHLPWWTRPGITDLGPSVAYIFASLGLFFAAAGATWSLDTKLGPLLGRFAWLSSPAPAELALPIGHGSGTPRSSGIS
jgi:nitrite reductase (NO-forming)